jgi:transmembrane sensor
MIAKSRREQIETEAGEWLVKMSDRLVSIDQRAQFDAWFAADPEHAQAYRRQRGILQLAGTCADLLEEARAERTLADESHRKRLSYAGAAAASIALVVGADLFGGWELGWFSKRDRFETVVAQVKDIRLKDGTLVTLGASSQIAVEFGEQERRVRLTRGEAFFDVTRDSKRPFFVTAGGTVVRVLGTKFDVHYGQTAVRVAVVEGRVEVMQTSRQETAAPQSKPLQTQVLTAGRTALTTEAGAIATSIQSNTEDLGAWRHGRLVYVDARLGDIISDINRYFDGEIELEDRALADQRITLTLLAADVYRGLELLEEVVPVRTVRTSPKRIVLVRKSGA